MSFALLAPLGLAALAALVVPIVIHLVRRLELQTTPFAALRWISERIRPRRRLRFERPWLLLLRLALLVLFAALLARPVLTDSPGVQTSRVFVAPRSDIAAARAAVSTANADWRWLAPGFPAIETQPPSMRVPVASLLREADAALPAGATLTVVVPEQVSGLDGERSVLAHAVDWHVVPGRMPADETASPDGKLEIAVRYTPSAETSLKYLEAAIAALNATGSRTYALDAQPQNVPIPDSTRALVWLGSEPTSAVSAWIEAGGTAIVDHQPRSTGAPAWRDADGNVIARVAPSGRGRLVALASTFSPREMPALLDADFPARLRNLIEGTPPPPTEAAAEAMQPRTVDATSSEVAATPASTRPLDPWLALAIALFVLAERVVATRTREVA
ncbi:MAG TPA: BatA domain-containing protein [Rhodanobacteraceae bacterium]|nr:BatA domain-containing protein [Rhodanobacteraceae bacterium]